MSPKFWKRYRCAPAPSPEAQKEVVLTTGDEVKSQGFGGAECVRVRVKVDQVGRGGVLRSSHVQERQSGRGDFVSVDSVERTETCLGGAV